MVSRWDVDAHGWRKQWYSNALLLSNSSQVDSEAKSLRVMLDLGQHFSNIQGIMPKAEYQGNWSPSSTTTLTSITSTKYYQSLPTSTTIHDWSFTTPTVDLTITKL